MGKPNKQYRKKILIHRNSSMDNHLITVNSFLNADYKNKTEEEFKECLDTVPNINRLLICRRKCGNKENYERVLQLANVCLSMAMIERRLGVVDEYDLEEKYR